MAGAPVLSVRNLSVDFKTDDGVVHAVSDVSFDVAAGETLGIVGESGSGKSVTVRSLIRLLPATARVGGSIRFHGESVPDFAPARLRAYRRSEIGMIFQDPHAALNPVRRIGDFLTEPAATRSRRVRRAALDEAAALLADVGIRDVSDVLRRYPHELSGGMLQRVMIASVMAARPEVILADEPTTALDVTTQSDVLALLTELRRERGAAVIFISHDIELVGAVCDRILVMYRGRLVESLSAQQLRDGDVQEPYTRALLACRPDITRKVRRLPVIDASGWGDRYQ